MSGYTYGSQPPTVHCPWCGDDVTGTAEYVDIGVGMQQCTAHGCISCQAVEISPFDERTYSKEESDKGWTYPADYAVARRTSAHQHEQT